MTKPMQHINVTPEQAELIDRTAHQMRMSRAEFWRWMAEYYFRSTNGKWPEYIDNRRKESETK
jgi:hypothetical protein